MKIIIVHTYYQLAGGEDKVFELESELLSASNSVVNVTFCNKSGLKGFLQFLLSIWNVSAAGKLKKKILELKPDIIHIHNWHYASGPLLIRTAKKMSIPVVLTLHNYRLICPSGTLFNNNNLFVDSTKVPFPWKAVRNRVYRNSLIQTFYLALIVWFHKKIKTWQMVDKYIVLTEFAKKIFIDSNFGEQENKYFIKPNFVVKTTDVVNFKREPSFLFVGRLSEEKGINVLLEAFKDNKHKLEIVGDGPYRDLVEEISGKFENISYLGSLDKANVLKMMRKCTALIFPSIWYEGMPITIIEAYSCGTAVIASNLGAMSAMIIDGKTGLLFDANNYTSLTHAINKWTNLKVYDRESMYQNAMNEYNLKYSSESNINELITVYSKIIN